MPKSRPKNQSNDPLMRYGILILRIRQMQAEADEIKKTLVPLLIKNPEFPVHNVSEAKSFLTKMCAPYATPANRSKK